jgi:hypothetical protein
MRPSIARSGPAGSYDPQWGLDGTRPAHDGSLDYLDVAHGRLYEGGGDDDGTRL